ncbi:MAG: HNH endonuclease [Rhodospirillaceae bacterium]|nr:HNH endonuclease [Rhodospirillaceae bacterium]
MTKAVFTTKVYPTYDDLPEVHYHFPRTYLRVAEAAVGDWIVYYEPSRISGNRTSRGGRMSYFATARVTSIEKDQTRKGHYYAYVSDYLELDRAVPFRENSHYYESRLRRADGKTNKGAFGRSVRPIEDIEYELILRAGFSALLTDDDRLDDELDAVRDYTPATVDRPLIQRVVTRPFREAAFSRQVKDAYDHTCAFTGFQIRNGGGRSEVQAAHIRPVKDRGPDSIRNGLALSSTVHWMFDRGLISLDEDYSMLIADNRIPEAISSMFHSDRQLHVPASRIQSPHPQFIRYHRDNVFLG